VLSGVTFAIISAVFGVLSGIVVDRVPRKPAILISGVMWAGLTVAQSFAVNFITIIIPRIGEWER
jgi:MFS family permease